MGSDAFGELLRECRLAVGWTQDELAGRSGVSAHSISVLEAGRRQPRLSSVGMLAEALGLDPGRREQLLAAARNAVAPPAPISPPEPPPAPQVDDRPSIPVPRQLPCAVAGFTGRTAQLKELTSLLDRDDAVVIAAINGSAGVGKTALAVHWSHQVADRFPDGQLYANLRGFDPSGQPVPPAEAIRGFLDALGVPAQGIPAGLAEQAALYRSRLADRRVLVVLDNARDTSQVRPLLPGTARCMTVITSRDNLGGLIVSEGAQAIALDLMTSAEADDLLASRGPGAAGRRTAGRQRPARNVRAPAAGAEHRRRASHPHPRPVADRAGRAAA
ncbi:helix-turn-helix transcriptional regulator [Kutzneria sp. 744]|uniref:helix-turn-helix domain-containing protein n=1 Tax=Kutzneria sp. (strain 744) TaxID=345341 RepID=UPI0004B3488A|nr:helix-turn-helix transcriptional regulator [Kutzneria sp. 744]